MKGLVEVFSITALLLVLFVIARHFWHKNFGAPSENRHALLEDIETTLEHGALALNICYRLPVSGSVEISARVDGEKRNPLLEKKQKAGYYRFKCTIDNPGEINKLCFKAPGTYLEKDIKKT